MKYQYPCDNCKKNKNKCFARPPCAEWKRWFGERWNKTKELFYSDTPVTGKKKWRIVYNGTRR